MVSGMFCSDSGDVLYVWCFVGLGVLLCEIWDIYEEFCDGCLVCVLLDWEVIFLKISVVWVW